jgi:dihydroorotate dehydrogenase (NAD+) catalytic subunit
MLTPFYDPEKSYQENFEQGPFGAFSNGEVVENTSEPKYDFLGFKVNSPFGIPAGPLINGNFLQAALDKGFDIVTYKTVRSAQYPCHPWPNILSVKVDGDLTPEVASGKLVANKNYEEPLSITNSFGVPSFAPEFWQKDLTKVVQGARSGQIVVGAFQGTKREGQSAEEYINDFKVTAKLVKDTGVKVMEVNLSCPNEGTNNLLCYDTERSVKVVQAIKGVIGGTPLIIKIGYFKDGEVLEDFVKKVGSIVQGISAINTISAEIVDENGAQALPGEGRLRSGVCGSSIKWAGLQMVQKLKALREKLDLSYTIIGVGGCMTADDFFEYKEAGADVVMSATGAMWNPYLGREVALELKERLK